ncbi:integral membrane protein LafC [Lachnospiraceae bacterium KM106-2]|nr:integral membrane protein LafC [Lachnospiraceae bacterium KM106-2]
MNGVSRKGIIKTLFFLIIIGLVIYVFRGSIGPISAELAKTSKTVMLLICLASIVFGVIDGWNLTELVRTYDEQFPLWRGILATFYASFYRVITFGSGPTLAYMHYLGKYHIPAGESFGICTVQYVLHKLTIAIYSSLCIIFNFSFFQKYFHDYMIYLLLGYGLTLGIVAFLLLVCISAKFHQIVLYFIRKFKKNPKIRPFVVRIEDELNNLRNSTKRLLKGKLAIKIIGRNLIKFTCYYLIPYVILFQSSHLSVVNAISITSLATVLAGVIPTPAGIGSIEFIFVLFFSVIVTKYKAAKTVILYRFATYIFPFVIGGIEMIRFNIHLKKENILQKVETK